MKATRRQLAIALLGGAAATGQNPAPPIPANAEGELQLARTQLRKSIDEINKVKLPPATEPAFQFRA
jgi:hypothetical protein